MFVLRTTHLSRTTYYVQWQIFKEAKDNGKLVGLGRIAWSGNHLPTYESCFLTEKNLCKNSLYHCTGIHINILVFELETNLTCQFAEVAFPWKIEVVFSNNNICRKHAWKSFQSYSFIPFFFLVLHILRLKNFEHLFCLSVVLVYNCALFVFSLFHCTTARNIQGYFTGGGVSLVFLVFSTLFIYKIFKIDIVLWYRDACLPFLAKKGTFV